MSISENIHFAVRDAGKVSAILLRPQKAESLLVLVHGAGAGMSHPFMESLATELAAASEVNRPPSDFPPANSGRSGAASDAACNAARMVAVSTGGRSGIFRCCSM